MKIPFIILASFGCNYFLSAIACEPSTFNNGCLGFDDCAPRPSWIANKLLPDLLNAHPSLIRTEHVLIQPNTHPMCVVVVASTQKLARVPEFPRDYSFKSFKRVLLSNDFTVYELMHTHDRLPHQRQVIFTHEYFRNQVPCTTAAVTKRLADCSTFEYNQRPDTGLHQYIWHSNVTFIGNERKDSLIDANLLGPGTSRGINCIQVLLNLLRLCPDLISMNRAQIQPNSNNICAIIIKRTGELIDREPTYRNFGHLKQRLLAVGFTVYEYDHGQGIRLSRDREVILTHDSFRDEAQCTIGSVSKAYIDRFRGHTKFINPSDVSILNQLQDGVGHPAILQTILSSAPQAASGSAQASSGQQTNVALQQSKSEAKRKRQSVQDVGEDVDGVRHKQPKLLDLFY